MSHQRHQRITARLTDWFRAAARDLPWRLTPRNPYYSLVSEAMLQQTQVSRVLEKFDAFIARFPTVQALAEAPEQAVLAAWSGLGYYRRARNLQNAARAIVERHNSAVPSDFDSLRALPGVGAYTAGAITSIVFDQPVPAVDANAHRVLLRIEGLDASAITARELNDVATSLVRAADSPAQCNEALMELGALVCLPANPRCADCPLARQCKARRAGAAATTRHRKPTPNRRDLFLTTVLVTDAQGRVRLHQRPTEGRGLWAGMFQPPTLERPDRPATPTELRAAFGVKNVRQVTTFYHTTSHRLVHFHVFTAAPTPNPRLPGRWYTPEESASLPLPNPHRRMLAGSPDMRTR